MRLAIDCHKKNLVWGLFEDDGKLVRRGETLNTQQGRDRLARSTPDGAKVVLESGTYGKPVTRRFLESGHVVRVADAHEVRNRAGKGKKNDWKDVLELEKQDRLEVIKDVYVPSLAEEELRCLVRHRVDLAEKGTIVKNQVHAQLGRNGITPPAGRGELFGPAGLRFLVDVDLPRSERVELAYHLRELEVLGEQIDAVDRELAEHARCDERVRLLMTMRGVDYYTACVVVAELGDPLRFPDGKHVGSYAGLVPREHQSGDTHYRGSITKRGPTVLRRALVGAATSVIKRPGPLQGVYRRIMRRRGSKRAKVAVARKMLVVLWRMLVTGEVYRGLEEDLVERKMRRMQQRAQRIEPGGRGVVVARMLERGKSREEVLSDAAAIPV